jgi:ABC-type Fe3+-siderophore transport system permease subunit
MNTNKIFIVFITTFILWMNLLLEIRNTNAITLKETTARQLAKSEKRTNLASTFV